MKPMLKSHLKQMIAKGKTTELLSVLEKHQQRLFTYSNLQRFQALAVAFEKHQGTMQKGNVHPDDVQADYLRLLGNLVELVEDMDENQLQQVYAPIEDLGKTSEMEQKITALGLWDELVTCAREAVVAAGITAMGYYNESWSNLQNVGQESRNPSTNADVAATVSLLRAVDSTLPQLCQQLGCGELQYFAEETGSPTKQMVENQVSAALKSRIQGEHEFFSPKTNAIRVIVDAIDGTGNFKKGFPIFCSAMAIIVNDTPRVSAIYDPVHHIVYTGLLAGDSNQQEIPGIAHAWHVSIGQKRYMPPIDKNKRLVNEHIGIHFTRSKRNQQQLKEMVGLIEHLVAASSGVYAINSGVFSLAEVARGVLGGFINNKTNPWDVTAGEVLIKAIGGKVTDFHQKPISYAQPGPISVVAAPTHRLFAELCAIIEKGFQRT